MYLTCRIKREQERVGGSWVGSNLLYIGITKVLKVEATNVGRYRNLVPGAGLEGGGANGEDILAFN